MSESLRFTVLKDMIEKNIVQLKLERRKCIDRYNDKIRDDVIKNSKLVTLLHLVSSFAGITLFLGFALVFMAEPWWHGLLVSFISIVTRVMIWNHFKDTAFEDVKKDIWQSEENFQKLYKDQIFYLINKETQKEARHPKKWTVVLPNRDEIELPEKTQ